MSQVDIPGLPFNGSPPGTSLFEISNSGVSESTSLDDIIFGLQPTSEKDVANGYAGLDGSGLISISQIPDLQGTYQVITEKGLPNGYASLDGSGTVPLSEIPDLSATYQVISEKGVANGYASLDALGDVPLTQIPDLSGTYQVISEKDAANGYAGLDGSGFIKLSAYPAGTALQVLRRNAGNTALEFADPVSSPLTTKGDLFGYDTTDNRIPVGTNNQVLTADSVEALGVKWADPQQVSDTPWLVNHDAAGFNLINVTQFETNATNPAGSGVIRLGDAEAIAWRNSSNDGDFDITSDSDELFFNGWEVVVFADTTDVDFTNAALVGILSLTMNGGGALNMSDAPANSFSTIQFTASNQAQAIALGNTEVISWEKNAGTGYAGLSSTATDEFVIGFSAASPGALVAEYNFTETGADFLGNNLTMGAAYIDLGEISTPSNPAVNVGRLYTKDVAAITKLFFLDSAGTETDVLASSSPLTTKGDIFVYDTGNQRLPVGTNGQVLQANSVEATGLEWVTPGAAAQTPWTQDIDADGFDLQDLSNIVFRSTTGAPAGTLAAIYAVLVGGIVLNVPAADSFDLHVNASLEYSFDSTDADWNGNNIINLEVLTFNNAVAQITDNAGGMELRVVTGDSVTVVVNSVDEYEFDATDANFNANNLTNAVFTTSITVANALNWSDGVKQTFNPDNTNAGLNVGSNALEPSVPVDGDLFYDSTALAMKARINGAWVSLGSGGGAANQIVQLNTSITVTDTGADGLANTVIDGVSKIQSDINRTIMNATRFELAAATTDSNISGNVTTLNTEGNYFEFNNTVATLDGISVTDWQPGSFIHLRFRDANATGVTLVHQASTTPPIQPLFLIGATNFQVTNANDEIIFTFMWDGTNWVEVNRSTAAAQTPWAQDIDAAGFDLTDLSNLEFQNTTGAPAAGTPAIWVEATQMNFNVPTGDFFQMNIQGVKEYTFETTEATWGGNDLTGVNDFTLLGVINFPDGVRQTFNPDATNSGLNVGTQSDPDPTSPVNGDIYYNTTNNKFRVYEAGSWTDMVGGAEDFVWTANHDAAGFALINLGFLEMDGTAADAGQLRMANLDAITWRNFANSGNNVLLVDADDNLTTQMPLNGLAGDLVFKRINFEFMRGTATGISVTGQADIDTFVNLTEIATPANPAANDGRLYVKDVSTITHLFFLDSAGTETDLLAAGGDVSGPASSTDNEFAVFSGATGKVIKSQAVDATLSNAGEPTWPRAMLFTNYSAGLPAASSTYIQSFFSDLTFNVSTANELKFTINGGTQYIFTATTFTMNDKNIIIGEGYFDFESISSPASTGAATRGRLFLDLDNSNHLTIQRNGVEVDLEDIGGQSPWASDIEAATFDLNNLGNLNFSLTGATGLPAITEPYITWDDTLTPDAMRFNVPTGQEYAFYVNGVEEYHWSSTIFDMHNNQITNVGTFLQSSLSTVGIMILGRSDEVTAQDASDIRMQAGNTRYAEIITHMVSAVSGSEIGELEFLIKNDNTTTMDSLIRLVGGATAASARIFLNAPMGTTLDMVGFVVNNVGSIRSNAGASLVSTVGFVRMGNAELIGWRNNGDTADHTITFNASDQFVIQVTSGSDYTFSESAFNMANNELQNVGMFNFQSRNELTIAAGVVTITRSWHSIDTEANAATDDLNTINGGVNGRVIVIGANSPTRTVVVKDGTGNIQCAGDFSMDHSNDMMTLIYDGTNWLEISRSDNSP